MAGIAMRGLVPECHHALHIIVAGSVMTVSRDGVMRPLCTVRNLIRYRLDNQSQSRWDISSMLLQ